MLELFLEQASLVSGTGFFACSSNCSNYFSSKPLWSLERVFSLARAIARTISRASLSGLWNGFFRLLEQLLELFLEQASLVSGTGFFACSSNCSNYFSSKPLWSSWNGFFRLLEQLLELFLEQASLVSGTGFFACSSNCSNYFSSKPLWSLERVFSLARAIAPAIARAIISVWTVGTLTRTIAPYDSMIHVTHVIPVTPIVPGMFIYTVRMIYVYIRLSYRLFDTIMLFIAALYSCFE